MHQSAEERAALARWVLDGHEVSPATGAAAVATAAHMAARILRVEHATEALVAAIRAAQPAAEDEAEEKRLLLPFSLASAPAALAAELHALVKDGALEAQLAELDALPPFAALCDEMLGDEEARAQAGSLLVAIKTVWRPRWLRCTHALVALCCVRGALTSRVPAAARRR
jgi:hypothetical protein